MTTRTNYLIAGLAIASLAILGSRPAAAQSDPCAMAVTPPAGGFTVNNTTGINPPTPIIHLQFYSAGDATYAEVSNNADFSNSAFYEVAYPYDGQTDWSLASGYGDKTIYVRYVNSCKAMPGATVIIEVTYYPSFCYVAPTGTFGITSLSGSTVSSPNVKLSLSNGNAAYAMVANTADFSNPTTIGVGYPYENILDWILSAGYGTKTVYARYLNECQAQPTAPVTVTFNYPNPACSIGITPPPYGFMVVSLSGSNVKARNVKLGMYGGNASYMEVSNNANFSGSVMYPYASTLNWMLSAGYGNKTVWVRYWNACKTISAPYAVSISFNYRPY